MDLSIIIVSWQVKERLKANLKALFSSEGDFKFEVFVVDNNSSDGSVGMVRNNFPRVTIVENQENLGFSKANNQAIKLANGRFILLLNPDMLVYPDTLAKSLEFARAKPQAVVSSVCLLDTKGEVLPHVRRFPKLFDQLMIILKLPHLFPSLLDSYLLPNFDYNKEAKVDSVRGSFFLINKEAFFRVSGQKFPLLDERYFIWFEEVDFCRQVYKLGGEVWYNPLASCRDYVGQSFSLVKRRKTQEYFKDSMLKYFDKWKKPYQKNILSLAWKFIGVFVK